MILPCLTFPRLNVIPSGSKELLDKKMIEEIDEKDGNKFYIITQKGNQFIAEFDKIKQFTESFGL